MMVAEQVWVSDAMCHPAHQRRITHSLSDESTISFAIDCREKNDRGDILPRECFPEIIYVSQDAQVNYDSLPHLFFAGSYWVISGKTADVLRSFDLGNGSLYETKVLKKDRVTPIGENWYCINFGNVKQAFQGGALSPKAPPSWPDAADEWKPPIVLEDNDLSVSRAAFVGPDIWIDSRINRVFFVSGRLASALKKAGVANPFYLKKCRLN